MFTRHDDKSPVGRGIGISSCIVRSSVVVSVTANTTHYTTRWLHNSWGWAITLYVQVTHWHRWKQHNIYFQLILLKCCDTAGYKAETGYSLPSVCVHQDNRMYSIHCPDVKSAVDISKVIFMYILIFMQWSSSSFYYSVNQAQITNIILQHPSTCGLNVLFIN